MLRWRLVPSVMSIACAALLGCGDGSGKAPPPTQSDTVQVPLQITTVYALEQTDDGDYTARARYYDALQIFDWAGNAGTIALSPGDAAFAAGTRLDIETRTETLGTLRVDYSQTIPKGEQDYLFELRRPEETISATLVPPTPFTMTIVDNASKGGTGVTIAWEPVARGAKVSILAKTETPGCALFEEGGLTVQPVDDTGKHEWVNAESFRQAHDCPFDITVERRERTVRPATWKKGTLAIPTNGVHAESVRKSTVRLTLLRR